MENSYPEDEIDKTDSGADTLGRYRYQAIFAALISLDLLMPNTNISEIYHEHHEDVLVRKNNGSYLAYQVKTRLQKYSPLKFNDDVIHASINKFIRFEKKYPEQCEKFIIVSNCHFFNGANSNDLEFCIEMIKENKGDFLNNPFSMQVKKLIDNFEGDSNIVLTVLEKTETMTPSPLDGLKNELLKKLASINGYPVLPYEKLDTIADSLIAKMLELGSLSYSESKDTRLRYEGITEVNIEKSIIERKKVTKELVQSILDVELYDDEPLLRYLVPIKENTNGYNDLNIKLQRGNISEENKKLIKNLTYSAELYFAQLLHKYGPERAKVLREHLRLVTQNECQEIYDKLADSEEFGTEMLNVVREKLRARYDSEIKYRYTGCTYEHLIGVSGILTNDCDLWWSEKFDLGVVD